MPRALITGITGQDGSYLSELLVAGGTEVHGLVLPGDPALDALKALVPDVVIHKGDLGSFESVQEVVAVRNLTRSITLPLHRQSQHPGTTRSLRVISTEPARSASSMRQGGTAI